eukprot:Skav216806  [mRNA]  locus=scaffold2110:141873:144123:- [translate_table: standard]
MSDRLYLEETCPALQQLLQKLVADPKAPLEEMDCGDVLVLKVQYPFLKNVWQQGSEELLHKVWEGLPVRFALDTAGDEMKVAVEKAALGRLNQPEAVRCVERIASTRIWLLIGPLIQRLRWLQDAVVKGDEAAKKTPLNAQEARAKAIGQPPAPCMVQLRNQEHCKGTEFSLPCSFHEPKDKNMLSDLRGLAAAHGVNPNVGFLSLTLTDQHVRGATEDKGGSKMTHER